LLEFVRGLQRKMAEQVAAQAGVAPRRAALLQVCVHARVIAVCVRVFVCLFVLVMQQKNIAAVAGFVECFACACVRM